MLALTAVRGLGGPKAFMAWFGPRGVATMTYSLLVLASGIDVGDELFGAAALVVVCSIVAHGLTDTPGSEWLARRSTNGGIEGKRP